MSDWKHLFCKAFHDLNFIAIWCINSEKIIGKNDLPYHYKKIGYNIDVLRQTACLVVNPIKINGFTSLIARRSVGLLTEWRYHPKSNLRVTQAVGDWHPFRVVLGRAYAFAPEFKFCYFCPHVCFILVLILISMFLR